MSSRLAAQREACERKLGTAKQRLREMRQALAAKDSDIAGARRAGARAVQEARDEAAHAAAAAERTISNVSA